MASPNQAFQPLTAKNFLSLKSTTKPVPPGTHSHHHGGGGGVSSVTAAASANGPMFPPGHSSNQIGPRRGNGSVGKRGHQNRNATTCASDHGLHSKSYLDTENLLASLPHQQQKVDGSHHSANSYTHQSYHDSSISNISQERDLTVIEVRQQQQEEEQEQRQQTNYKQKVRFEHHHRSCPINTDGLNDFHLEQQVASSSKTGTSSPRTTKDQVDDEIRLFDLAHSSRHGVSLSNLPVKSGLQQTLLLRRQKSKDTGSDFVVESLHGDKLASIESPVVVGNETLERIVSDVDGNIYAVILEKVVDGRIHRYKICGTQPIFPDQRRSRDSGLFTYAEVKNSSGIGVKFTMKLRGDTQDKYVTESFGPSIFQWGRWGQTTRARGFVIKKMIDAGSKKGSDGKEVCKITFLGAGKALSISPDQDFRLMIAYSAIIDEMVEKRLR